MPLTAYCSTCDRSLYVESSDELVCPVCSSPLEVADEQEAVHERSPDEPHSRGAK